MEDRDKCIGAANRGSETKKLNISSHEGYFG